MSGHLVKRHHHRVSVRGGRLAVVESMPALAVGLPLLLLHGFTGSGKSWNPLMQALGCRLRIVAVDLPGHGQSVLAPDSGGFTFEGAAQGLDSVLDLLRIDYCALLGYSLGGRLALYYALTRSQRVRRLVVESGSPGLANPSERAARRKADEDLARDIESGSMSDFVTRWEQVPVLASQRRLPEPVRKALHRERLACAPMGLAASLRGMGTGAQPWLGNRLDEIHIPVLLLAGELDAKFTRIARAMAHGLARARLVIVEQAGHSVHLEQPDLFARHVGDFVRGGEGRDDQVTRASDGGGL